MSRNKREGWYCGYGSIVVNGDYYGHRRRDNPKHMRGSRVFSLTKARRHLGY